MTRIPLDTVDEPEDVERPCDCCGEPTTYTIGMASLLDGDADGLPCCGRPTCRRWVTEMLHKMD